VGDVVNSNTSSITGIYGNSLDLVVQASVVPGTYGNDTTCIPQLTINNKGIITETGCLSIGGGSGNTSFSIFLGTANQIIVTEINNETLQFSTPQNIATTSSPTWAGTTITGATANTLTVFGASKQLQSLALSNGQLAIGSTGALPVAAVPLGTANQIVVTPGPGSLTFSLASTIAVANLTLSGVTPNSTLYVDGNGNVLGLSLLSGQIIIGSNGSAPVANYISGTTNQARFPLLLLTTSHWRIRSS
jgi:hypothetical protein